MISELNWFWSDRETEETVVVTWRTITFNDCESVLFILFLWDVFQTNESGTSVCPSLLLPASLYPPSSSPFCLPLRSEVALPSSSLPLSQDDIILYNCLRVPIHHPDHHRQHQQHHLRVHTHARAHTHMHMHASAHTYGRRIKEKRAPTASWKERGRNAGREGGEDGQSCWGRQKPLTCALPTIHLNKPQHRQNWWVRLQATEGKQQHKKQEREEEPPHPRTHRTPPYKLHLATSREESYTSCLLVTS